ncbi:MAG: hypothetical protein M1833_005841 [Piccolia ochrophora]|nr:MAG: hypothetical protein M1833_005841 [Piccolia ochrophora]
MAKPGHEREHTTDDTVGATHSTNHDEPVATQPLTYVESDSGDSALDPEKKSPSTEGEAASPPSSEDDEKATDQVRANSIVPKKKWYRRMNPFEKSQPPPVPEERSVSKEYGASFWSVLTFQWMGPLMRVGYQRPLESNDIWLVNPERATDVMAVKLSAAFQKGVEDRYKYPLLWAMYETFKKEFLIGGACQLVANVLQVISPFTLRYLIAFATDAYYAQQTGSQPPHIGKGLGLAFGITAMQVVQSFGTNHYIYRGMMVGGESRAVLIAVIFEKAMKISGRAKAGGREIDEDSPKVVENTDSNSTKRDKSEKRKGAKVTPNDGKDISGDGRGWGNGRIVNLMSTDTYRIDQASGMFHLIWTAPLAMIITLVVLLINITYSALAGFGLLVIGTPILTKAIKSLFLRRKAINKITDQRVSLTQEILHAVKFVKYFGWETSFLERIGGIRQREIRAIQFLLAIRNGINAVSMASSPFQTSIMRSTLGKCVTNNVQSLPVFASMLAFITYALSSHELDPARIFSSLALFNSLRLPLNLLPLVIGQCIDAWASIARIQDFLLAEEMEEHFLIDHERDDAIEAVKADFTWERTVTRDPENSPALQDQGKLQSSNTHKSKKGPEDIRETKNHSLKDEASIDSANAEPFRLRDLDFAFKRNELVAVIGSVGSGKSSLLAALAGDMRKTAGEVVLGASRALCPQYAWIQNASVRDNILFGKEYDRKSYSDVVDACALRPDLDMLPSGDKTEIGERGITISGGQKQRLNIARAIYFDADIILMDDPLSAVDAHVGRHIFDHAICGLLRNKCRVLATHQLHVLNRCDRVIWMQEGRIVACDTYTNLMENNKMFADMMVSTAADEEQETEKSDAEDDDKEEAEQIQRLVTTQSSKQAATLMQAEERAVRSVPWSIYSAYIKASGSLMNGPLVVILLIMSQGANIVTSLWLSYWISNKFQLSMGAYIGTYAALGVIQAVLMFVFSVALSVLGTTSSKVMLEQAITRVLRAPMSFFDTTPLGRITNRFSKDVDTMDNTLTDAMRMYFFTLAMILSVFILIIVFFHFFAIALVPLFCVFLFSAGYYRASAREMKRHEAVLRSVVFSRFGEALAGTASIRAYGLQDRFVRSVRDSIDEMNSAYYLTFSNQRWLSVRLDCIGNLLVLTTGILVVTSRFNVSPSIAGLVLSYILSIVQMIQFTVRQLAEVENAMNATERLHHYGTQLEEEAPSHLGDVRDTWPEAGEIIFDNVQMRYREKLPLVLRGLSMSVKGGERIGIIGRTGAGKSSIMTTLFRLVELSGGSIKIDGLDISKIGLHDLRSRLAIIPQEPTLFRGTIRSNLDPFNEHTDLELWSALRQSDLVSKDASLDDKVPGRIHLDGIVEEEGLNFSLGQRQLMALARALVRGSQIIVCDEATSSVDMETDQKIQQTIATGFKGKTLLCIAHRLRTIINYDRICVMDAGNIAELDTPLRLFEQEQSIFRSMCNRSGIRREDFTT